VVKEAIISLKSSEEDGMILKFDLARLVITSSGISSKWAVATYLSIY